MQRPFALLFKHAPFATILTCLFEILNGLVTLLTLTATAGFINQALLIPAANMSLLLTNAGLLLLAYGYTQLAIPLLRFCKKSIETSLSLTLRPQLLRKRASLPYELIETPETQDLIAYVVQNTESQIIARLSQFTTVLRLVIQISSVLAVLAVHVWWLLPLLLLGATPLLLLSFKGGAVIQKMDRESTVLTRMKYYLSDVLSSRETAHERTLFGFTKAVNAQFHRTHMQRSNLVTKTIAIEMSRSRAASLILNGFVLIALFALLNPLAHKAITLGLYISTTGAMLNLVRTVTATVSQLLFDYNAHREFMKDYTKFWALPSDETLLIHTPVQMQFLRLDILNLRFKYAGSDKYILNGLTMHIQSGKSYSLIGQNGAGKTTLTKILTGLYRDFEGEILINGKSIRDYTTDQLRGMFSIVYQDFAKYSIPLADNIHFEMAGDCASIVQRAGLEPVVDALPLGLEQPLGKMEESGVDLSGGEWQKIAIARALYRDCPFMILDEPTASLSPMMENELYNQFAKLSAGLTLLLISHRLASTKLSDFLYVLHEGRIAEEGTHEQLMKAQGLYWQMFTAQRSWYDEG